MVTRATTLKLEEVNPRRSLKISDFYKPWPKQARFHALRTKHRLQVGGFGSGKSRPLLMEAIMHCVEYPGTNSIILRKTIPDLKRTVIDKFEADVPKAMYEYGCQELGTFNKSDHIVYFPPVKDLDALGNPIIDQVTGLPKTLQSKLYFAACDRIEDVGKYLSTEFVFVGFEELGEFPYLIYDAMEGRNRCAIPNSRPCMAAATNPMGIGWGWIKKLWIDQKPVYGMDPEKYNQRDYAYVHSTVDDNPILIKDKKYVESLEKSPLREKIRYGNIETVSGQYFANFVEHLYVRPRSDFIFENFQPVWVGWDYGFGHFAVINFMTKAILKELPPEALKNVSLEEALFRKAPRLVNVTIEEIVLHEHTPKQQTEALIMSIPRLKDEEGHDAGYAWDIDSIHFSWERFNRTVENRTVADEVGDYLAAAGLPRPTRSNNDRIAGWTKMYEMLDIGEWFFLQGKCPTLVEALPLLVRGDGITVSAEDVVKAKGVSLIDDCGDSMRYAVAGFLLEAGEKSREQKLRDKLAGIKDPMQRHIIQFRDWNERNAEDRRASLPAGKIIPSWMRRVQGPQQ